VINFISYKIEQLLDHIADALIDFSLEFDDDYLFEDDEGHVEDDESH
jgi:hypothetical protein